MHATTIDSAAFLEKGIQSLTQLPPFSPILNKLMASLANEDVSVAELAEWIEKDAVMTGHVMRLVNSAAFGRRGTVSGVRHAIAILGLVKLRNTVLGISVCRMWTQLRTPKGWSTARFNHHSAATGIMADIIVQYATANYGEGAFVAGLLHDIGLLVIALSLSPQYLEVQELMNSTTLVPEFRTLENCELSVLGLTHAEFSAATLLKWNLPPEIQTAVKYHHHPDDSPEDTTKGLTLSRVVHVSDLIVKKMGIATMPEPAAAGSEEVLSLLEGLGLAAEAEKIIEGFGKEFEVLKGVF